MAGRTIRIIESRVYTATVCLGSAKSNHVVAHGSNFPEYLILGIDIGQLISFLTLLNRALQLLKFQYFTDMFICIVGTQCSGVSSTKNYLQSLGFQEITFDSCMYV